MCTLISSDSEGCAARGRRSAAQMGTTGFTLIELMVVLLILAMLTTIAAPRVTKYLGKAKSQTAQTQVAALSAAVDAFVIDVGRPPTDEEGLAALLSAPAETPTWDGPYIKKSASLTDPWGRAYRYRSPGQHSEYDIFSWAADGKEGGEGDDADVENW
jgi:general secretion pathway protein G